jgi:hypothetical protein
MSQPIWKCVGSIGDADPVLFGGGIVLVDETGVCEPELELYEPNIEEDYRDEDGNVVRDEETGEREFEVLVYRISIDRFVMHDGKLVNEREPGYAARTPGRGVSTEWWADRLEDVFAHSGMVPEQAVAHLCGDDPVARAHVYMDLIWYFGESNFDDYPLVMPYSKALERFEQKTKGG